MNKQWNEVKISFTAKDPETGNDKVIRETFIHEAINMLDCWNQLVERLKDRVQDWRVESFKPVKLSDIQSPLDKGKFFSVDVKTINDEGKNSKMVYLFIAEDDKQASAKVREYTKRWLAPHEVTKIALTDIAAVWDEKNPEWKSDYLFRVDVLEAEGHYNISGQTSLFDSDGKPKEPEPISLTQRVAKQAGKKLKKEVLKGVEFIPNDPEPTPNAPESLPFDEQHKRPEMTDGVKAMLLDDEIQTTQEELQEAIEKSFVTSGMNDLKQMSFGGKYSEALTFFRNLLSTDEAKRVNMAEVKKIPFGPPVLTALLRIDAIVKLPKKDAKDPSYYQAYSLLADITESDIEVSLK